MTFSPKAIEAAARAIYDLPLQDGDAFGTLIYMSDYIQPSSREDMQRQSIKLMEEIVQAALSAALAVDGMALVPVEPTEDMLDFGACYEDPDGLYKGHPIFDEGDISRDIYRAMLSAAPEGPAPALQGWRTFEDRPEPGRKFIALYNDGSGAAMFYAFDGGVIDSDGDEYYGWNPDDASYDLWAYLPDTVNFWCEVRAEDPVSLRSPPAASDREERCSPPKEKL